jgi:hypothetical protein
MTNDIMSFPPRMSLEDHNASASCFRDCGITCADCETNPGIHTIYVVERSGFKTTILLVAQASRMNARGLLSNNKTLAQMNASAFGHLFKIINMKILCSDCWSRYGEGVLIYGGER